MSNETAAQIPETDQRVIPLADYLIDAELDLTCLHSGVQIEDAMTIARTVIAYTDGLEILPPTVPT